MHESGWNKYCSGSEEYSWCTISEGVPSVEVLGFSKINFSLEHLENVSSNSQYSSEEFPFKDYFHI